MGNRKTGKQPLSRENRRRQNQKNVAITAGIITGVAVIAAGIVIAMALVGRPAPTQPADQTPAAAEESRLPTASETGSMAVSVPSQSRSEDGKQPSSKTASQDTATAKASN